MKSKFSKLLSTVLALAIVLGCFAMVPFSAFAEGPSTTFVDFENGVSPFTYNKNNSSVGKIYTEANGNKSLFVYGAPSLVSQSRLSDTAELQQCSVWDTDARSFTNVINNEGYKPTRVAFKIKPVFRSSNSHLTFNPLTFAGSNSAQKCPAYQFPVMSLFMASKEGGTVRQINWNQTNSGAATAGLSVAMQTALAENPEQVFTAVDSSADTAGRTVDINMELLSDNSADAADNDTIIDNLSWYDIEFIYDWDTENNKVTITGKLTVNNTVLSSVHTYTYNPELIGNYYNFGLSPDGAAAGYLLDNLAVYTEDSSGNKYGPNTATNFVNNYQELFNSAKDFNITSYINMSKTQKAQFKSQLNSFESDYATLTENQKLDVNVYYGYESVINVKKQVSAYDVKVSVADFENSVGLFKSNQDGTASDYFYNANGNKAFVMNAGSDLKTALPAANASGTVSSLAGIPSGYANYYGVEGYRPTKVSFKTKIITTDSNNHINFTPLTFAYEKGKRAPVTNYLGVNFFTASSRVSGQWSEEYSGVRTISNTESNAVALLTAAEKLQRTGDNWTQMTPMTDAITLNASDNDTKTANLNKVEAGNWYNVEFVYTWGDSNSTDNIANDQVKIEASIGNSSFSWVYNWLVTFNPTAIDKAYNFGYIAQNASSILLMDDFAYFCENPTNPSDQLGPHVSLLQNNNSVITTAENFDLDTDYATLSQSEKTAFSAKINEFITEYNASVDCVKANTQVATAHTNVLAMKTAIDNYESEAVMRNYLTKYADVLDNVSDSLVVSNLDEEGLITRAAAATEEFNGLSDQYKSSTDGVKVQAKLKVLNKQLGYLQLAQGDGVYFQNFENGNDFAPYYTYSDYPEENSTTTTEFTKNGSIANDSANTTVYKVVKPTAPNGFHSSELVKYGQFLTADKSLYTIMADNGKYLSSGSFDMYVCNSYGANAEQMVNFRFADGNNYSFIGVFGNKYNENVNGTTTYQVATRKYNVSNSTTANFSAEYTFDSGNAIDSKWWHFDFMFDNDGYFYLVATNGDGRFYAYKADRADQVTEKSERILAFGLMSIQETYIDNVKLRFSGTDTDSTDLANFFASQANREVSEMSAEKIVPYDFAKINAFVENYNNLSASAKTYIPAVTEQVNALTTAMNLWNTISDETIAESFNTIYSNNATAKAYSVLKRLTAAQQELVRTNYTTTYNAVINAVSTTAEDGVVNIMCAGDSITYGSSADEHINRENYNSDNEYNTAKNNAINTLSYPAQLQAKLDTKFGSGKFKVDKAAMPGVRVLLDVSTNTHSNGSLGQYRGSYGNLGYYASIVPNPDIVIIMLGTNDGVIGGGSLECSATRRANLKAAYTDLVQGYLSLDCNPTVIMATIPTHGNSNLTESNQAKYAVLDEIYKEIAVEYDINLIDINALTGEWNTEQRELYFSQDNLHPNKDGYDQISQFYADYIEAGTIDNREGACLATFQKVSTECTHNWSEWETTTPVTCTTDGEKTRTCSLCGEDETETITHQGHDYEDTVVPPTCTAQGYTKHVCSVCGDDYTDTYTDAKHTPKAEWTVITAPSVGVDGESKLYCSVCNEVLDTKVTKFTGFHTDSGKTYYYEEGVMATGWKTINGKQYYFKQANGVMLQSTMASVGGQDYTFAEDGSVVTTPTLSIIDDKCYKEGKYQVKGWQIVNGDKYYFGGEDGKMLKDQITMIYENVYKFDESGKLVTDTLTVKGKKCYNSANEVQTGWQTIYSKQFYFKSNGYMIYGTQAVIGGVVYTFNDNGTLASEPKNVIVNDKCYLNGKYQVKGWQTVDGDKYYFGGEDGTMLKNQITMIYEDVCKFDESGKLVTDTLTIKGKKCYDAEGNMKTGWQTVYGEQFYFRASGTYAGYMMTGNAWIGGKGYTFNSNGVLVK